MDFVLFLLVNLTLFVRPAELIPALEGVPIYNYLILATLAACLPRFARQLQPEQLARTPITACIVAMIPAVAISHLMHFDLYSARVGTFAFLKLVVYYMVLMAVVNTTQRIRALLYAVALFASISSTIAVLHYYGVIDVPSITLARENQIDPETDEPFVIPRLCSTGVFGDPNDLSMLAVACIVICLFGMDDKRLGIFRIAWTIPLALFFLTLVLTKSRGGMLAFATAAGLLCYMRFGFWKTAIVAGIAIPVLLATVGGRQADLSGGMSGGTGQARLELWSGGLTLLKGSPLFGIGYQSYGDEVGQVAHNSFVHVFVELGLFGGALFLGAFWFAALSFWKISRRISAEYQFTTTLAFRRQLPYLLTILCGFSVSMFSLSRAYVEPTYLALGMANAYFVEARRLGIPTPVRLTPQRLGELLAVSIAFLLFIYLFLRFNLR